MSAITTISKDGGHAAFVALLAYAFPCLSWRHHGIGVLQAYLTEHVEPEVRVHVWHPDLVRPGIKANGDVHDHRFDMVSHVVVGDVTHEEWHESDNPNGAFTTTMLTLARAASDNNYHGPTTATEHRYDADVSMFVIPSGFQYTFPAHRFHRSPVTGLAVTIVEKHRQRTTPARLLHRVDKPFVPAFGHDMNDALVTRVLREARHALTLEYKERVTE